MTSMRSDGPFSVDRSDSMADECIDLASGELSRGDLAEAERLVRVAIVLSPCRPDILGNFSEVLRVSERLVAALSYARRAEAIRTDDWGLLTQVALAYFVNERVGRGIALHRQVIASAPGEVAGFVNFSRALLMTGNIATAKTIARRGCAIDSDLGAAAVNYASALLMLGEIGEGFWRQEARLHLRKSRAHEVQKFNWQRWYGEDLRGRSLLIWAEQGVGDQLFLGRYLQMAPIDPGKTVLEIEPRLVSMFQRAFPTVSVVPSDTGSLDRCAAMNIDMQTPLGSLPLVSLETVQAIIEARRSSAEPNVLESGYLVPDADKIAKWKTAFPRQGNKLKVATSWRGGISTSSHRPFHMAAEEFSQILKGRDATFINVQYDWNDAEIQFLENEAKDFRHPAAIDLRNDLEDVAAILADCDLLISAGTAVAWLAASLGIPVWNFNTGWLTVTYGTDHCPLFPSIRLFWRRYGESWAVVIEQIGRELDSLILSRSH